MVLNARVSAQRGTRSRRRRRRPAWRTRSSGLGRSGPGGSRSCDSWQIQPTRLTSPSTTYLSSKCEIRAEATVVPAGVPFTAPSTTAPSNRQRPRAPDMVPRTKRGVVQLVDVVLVGQHAMRSRAPPRPLVGGLRPLDVVAVCQEDAESGDQHRDGHQAELAHVREVGRLLHVRPFPAPCAPSPPWATKLGSRKCSMALLPTQRRRDADVPREDGANRQDHQRNGHQPRRLVRTVPRVVAAVAFRVIAVTPCFPGRSAVLPGRTS